MKKVDVIKLANIIIDVADGVEALGRICNCGKALLVIIEIVSEFITPLKKALKEKSAQDDLRRTKVMIKSKFVETMIKLSEVGFKDFFMKVLIFVLVVIVKILDVKVIENESVLHTVSIFFYIFNEAISLLDNVRKLRLPFLAKLKSMLEQFHDRAGEDEDV